MTWTRPDALELLARAPDPVRAAPLTRAQISAALAAATSPARRPRSSPRSAALSWASRQPPAASRHRRLRCHSQVPDRGDHHPE
jgi:hypothetical protein